MAVRFIKDPEATLDYTLDWTNWLVSDDFLVHASFVPDPGLNVVSKNIADSTIGVRTNTCATGWLSGGIAGQTYGVTCHITTDGGRQDDRTFYIVAREQ